MKKLLVVLASLFICSKVHATPTPMPVSIPSTVISSSITAAGGQAISTVTAPSGVGAYSAGYYNYVTNIHIEMYATGTLTGGATPVTCTTTNLGGLTFKLPTAAATGSVTVIDMQFANPLQATQGLQALVTCPGTTSVIWNVEVASYSGQ